MSHPSAKDRHAEILDAMQTRLCRFSAQSPYRLSYVNRAYARFWNRSRESLIGSSMLSLAREADIPLLQKNLEEIVCTKAPFSQEVQRINIKTGEAVWFKREWTPILDANGAVAEIQGLYTDITDLKMGELALAEQSMALEQANRQLQIVNDTFHEWQSSMRRKEMVFSSAEAVSAIGTFRTDQHGGILSLNRRAAELFGHSQSVCVGMNWTAFVLPEEIESLVAGWRAAIATQTPFQIEYHVYHESTGQTRSLLTEIGPSLSDQDEVEGFVGATFDLTEIRRATDEIERLNSTLRETNVSLEKRVTERTHSLALINEALQARNTELDRFSSIASHDLKEPLRGIRNYLIMFVDERSDSLTEDEEGYILLSKSLELATRAIALIDDLRNLTRIGVEESVATRLSLDLLLDEILETIGPLLQREQVEVIRLSPLPTIRYNRSHMRTVLQNLITNGIKYNEADQKRIEIWVEEAAAENRPDRPTAGALVLCIRDNGIGIPQKHHKRIFEMFKQLHPKNKYGEGTGAGLALVAKIVHSNGGHIWLDSCSEGETGTTFYVDLGTKG